MTIKENKHQEASTYLNEQELEKINTACELSGFRRAGFLRAAAIKEANKVLLENKKLQAD